MSRNILCVLEFDNYPELVMERAIWIAKSRNCNLQLLVCDPVTDLLGESFVYLLESQDIAESINESRDEAIKTLAAKAEATGLDVEVNFSTERNIADVVRREADAREPLYVVKGTHYHSPSERATLSHADWDLIRELQCPLWIVKPGEWRDPPVIVAAVDPVHAHDKPAHLDNRIIERAQFIADTYGGRLLVVHTYQSLDEIGSRAMWAFKPKKLPVEDLDRKIHDEHDRALKILGETRNLPEDSLYLIPGRAHEVLPAFAREHGASLVIMGALARSKLKQRVVGSTAARVLDHMPCDVLIAHAQQD
ncbi:MAG: universal stress protein [Gammaproteobacteria bacterium]|nr:universal stress protein [Gammaproteobacteria bacterium]NNF49598.1 universal stress protein [Woeseiaceae bacterium]MBT8093418.1 universal stress protein [Gammaproteobacteria bacterium]MBT8106212.1 universal stress protein [Gammaproteobacteria bacterium]NNK26226.1 universal stress protein [Woeseiaceae bacterium]